MKNKKARVPFSFCSVSFLANFTLIYVFNFSGRFYFFHTLPDARGNSSRVKAMQKNKPDQGKKIQLKTCTGTKKTKKNVISLYI